ncbi:MAG TPA: hypothetical protein VFW73_03710 [Lacipirellulaceae bacterium]|nr:hypothetical protein [Lacipirellulaceae bacterium]
MTDIPDEPDWSLLPHDPVKFFGLNPGFDGRDLKRTYNRLLRLFKPERFPDEFQRSRAAYEQLENAIRYGQLTEPAAQQLRLGDWPDLSLLSTPLSQPISSSQTSCSNTIPLHRRIQADNVSSVYDELKERADKSPYDYYALAILSDNVAERNGERFVDWLLQGLTTYPNEVGLSRLLHAYFGGPIKSEQCERLLVACATILREDLFFPITEPLWKLLLRTCDFQHFRATLNQCEKKLKGLNIDNRLAFYMQILKPSVWLADADWIEDSYQFIEQNFDRIPSFLDFELEVLLRLRTYIEIRETFISGNDFRRGLDQAMRDYFSEDQIIGDQSVLASQIRISQDPNGLAAAFADVANSSYTAFFELWRWVSYDVAERHVVKPKESLNERVCYQRTKELLVQLERQAASSRLGIKWATKRVAYRAAQAANLVFCALAFSLLGIIIAAIVLDARGNRRGDDVILIVAVPVGAAIGVFVGFRLCRRIRSSYWDPFEIRISADCYRELWQREIMDFLARSQIPHQTLRAYIQSYPSRTTSAPWIKHFVNRDVTLPIFAIAHHFVV